MAAEKVPAPQAPPNNSGNLGHDRPAGIDDKVPAPQADPTPHGGSGLHTKLPAPNAPPS